VVVAVVVVEPIHLAALAVAVLVRLVVVVDYQLPKLLVQAGRQTQVAAVVEALTTM
jgi:hypothetical protein